MKYFFLFSISSIVFFNPKKIHAQPYKKLHRQSIVIDTHNDVLSECFEKGYSFDQNLKGKTHSDLQRFKEGGVDVQIFSVWCDGLEQDPFLYANRQIDTLYATALRHPGKITIVKTSAELLNAIHDKKLAAMIGVEGGHMIEDDITKLDSLFKRGARYMTLTWNNSTKWATSAKDETAPFKSLPIGQDSLTHKGLTDFGKQVVKRMNELGMLVDLSHVGEQTFWDAITATTKPVLVSHSCVYNLCPAFRNLKDEQIKAIGLNGGVIHLNFYSGFLDSNFNKRNEAFELNHKAEKDSLLKMNPEPYFAIMFLYGKYKEKVASFRPPLSLLLNHLDHIVKLTGVDHVGLGSDFDGINSTPQQLDDVTNYPLITKALLERGYSKKDIRKIVGGNFLRLLKANEKLSAGSD